MQIESYSFGSISIDGTIYRKDIKIIDNSVMPDWWRKSGHNVVFEDVADILAAGPDVVIFGKGDPGQMRPDPALVNQMAEKGIEVVSLPTARAAEEFNRRVKENQKVAAGFHLTC
ncbi:MAG: Mth938-like domain-containing protein [Thermodesulfobacteriota bacterium]